jgi:hypothetical protein
MRHRKRGEERRREGEGEGGGWEKSHAAPRSSEQQFLTISRDFPPLSCPTQAVSSTSDGLAKVGIGAYFQRSKDDSNILLVKSVLKGSPSYATGMVKVGDEVCELVQGFWFRV